MIIPKLINYIVVKYVNEPWRYMFMYIVTKWRSLLNQLRWNILPLHKNSPDLLTWVHVLEGFQRNMYPKNMIPSTYNIDCYLCCDFRVHCSIFHYRAVIMGAMTSRITTHMIVYSTVYSGSDQRTSKLRVTGLCERNSPVTGEFWAISSGSFFKSRPA